MTSRGQTLKAQSTISIEGTTGGHSTMEKGSVSELAAVPKSSDSDRGEEYIFTDVGTTGWASAASSACYRFQGPVLRV